MLFRSTASTSTPACVSVSSYCSNWIDHQVLDIILNLENPKYVWKQPPLDLTKDSHTQYEEQPQNVARVFSFIFKTKPCTSNGLALSWKILQKTFCSSFDWSSLILNRSSQTELHNKFCSNLIPTLHKCIHFEQV